ncbi:MAG: hypothetical protein FWE41_09400 [Coriobacteriia bacterium]|nr:hypothetical protein [Coriobacteriia bacterium]MCL2750964.1 hypothetical protein [Coriobacteriia bacterium]
MFQFDLGQIGTLTPSPCSTLTPSPCSTLTPSLCPKREELREKNEQYRFHSIAS